MLRWKSSLKPAAAAATGITLETSAATIASGSSSQSPDVNIPAVSVNDILIFYCATYDNASPTSSPPSGWTKIIEQDSSSIYGSTVAAYWKRASGSASATTETWTALYPNNESVYIWVGAYSGCLTSGSPIDVSVGGGWSTGTSQSNSFSTTVDNAMVVSMAGVYNQSTTWSPDGEIVDLEFKDNINAWASVNGNIESTAGSKTVTASWSAGTRSAIVTLALKPAAAAANYRSTIMADSPVAYYRLGESSGTTASDETGSYDATYTNSPTLGEAGAISGDSNTSVLLASNEYAEIDSNLSITAYPFTLEAWVKTSASSQQSAVCLADKSKTNAWIFIGTSSSGKAVVGRRNTTHYTNQSTANANDNEWHHIVATFTNSSTFELYLDGDAQSATGSSVTIPSIDRASIGRIGESVPANYFNGTVDEVAVYDTALSASTIAAHYTAGTS